MIQEDTQPGRKDLYVWLGLISTQHLSDPDAVAESVIRVTDTKDLVEIWSEHVYIYPKAGAPEAFESWKTNGLREDWDRAAYAELGDRLRSSEEVAANWAAKLKSFDCTSLTVAGNYAHFLHLWFHEPLRGLLSKNVPLSIGTLVRYIQEPPFGLDDSTLEKLAKVTLEIPPEATRPFQNIERSIFIARQIQAQLGLPGIVEGGF